MIKNVPVVTCLLSFSISRKEIISYKLSENVKMYCVGHWTGYIKRSLNSPLVYLGHLKSSVLASKFNDRKNNLLDVEENLFQQEC